MFRQIQIVGSERGLKVWKSNHMARLTWLCGESPTMDGADVGVQIVMPVIFE